MNRDPAHAIDRPPAVVFDARVQLSAGRASSYVFDDPAERRELAVLDGCARLLLLLAPVCA
jgi:hypothetical protein